MVDNSSYLPSWSYEVSRGVYKLENFQLLLSLSKEGHNIPVYQATLRESSFGPCAIKMICRRDVQARQIETEVRNYRYLNKKMNQSPSSELKHIVKVYDLGYSKKADIIFIVMEKCDENLEEYMQRRGRLDESQAIEILSQICEGLSVLKKNSIFHCDIKPPNILVKRGDRNDLFKITDFGISKIMEAPGQRFEDFSGTVKYMAPQLLARNPFTSKADIFSLGICLYRMIFGKHPFPGEGQEYYAMVLSLKTNPNVLTFDEGVNVSAKTRALLKHMLAYEESKRISVEDLKKELNDIVASIDLENVQKHIGEANRTIHSPPCDLNNKSDARMQVEQSGSPPLPLKLLNSRDSSILSNATRIDVIPELFDNSTASSLQSQNQRMLMESLESNIRSLQMVYEALAENRDESLGSISCKPTETWNYHYWEKNVNYFNLEMAKVVFLHETVTRFCAKFNLSNGIQLRLCYLKFLQLRVNLIAEYLEDENSTTTTKDHEQWLNYYNSGDSKRNIAMLRDIAKEAESKFGELYAWASTSQLVNDIDFGNGKALIALLEDEKKKALEVMHEFLACINANADDLRAGLKILIIFQKLRSAFESESQIELFYSKLQKLDEKELRPIYLKFLRKFVEKGEAKIWEFLQQNVWMDSELLKILKASLLFLCKHSGKIKQS